MSDEEQIPVHSETWKQRDLIERIISRYVHVLSDTGGFWPTFLVQERDDDDIHETLEEINKHLARLDWVVRLYPDEPWLMQVLPIPTNQFPRKSVPFVMWIIAILSTVYAGEKWMSSGRPDGGWFHSNGTLDAFIGYSLPILGAIVAASFLQKHVAARYGVRVPHLFPLFGPAALWWPFGLIGFTSMPRNDARYWPDRGAMGNTAISAPLMLISLGMVFTFIGLKLTPENVALVSAPLSLELPLLVQIISLGIEGEIDYLLKTAWAHPFTRAGSALMFLGWISLLPIPTFPGGRIIIARMGMSEARSGSTQVMLLIVIMLFAFLFGAFSTWTIWAPVSAILLILLIQRGGDPRLPIVLDDMKGLSEKDHRKIGMLLFIAFLFALPAQSPFVMEDDWNEDLEFSVDSSDVKIEDGWANQTIKVSNPSLVTQDWTFSIMEGPGSHFNLTLNCGTIEESENNCSGVVEPLDSKSIEVSYQLIDNQSTVRRDIVVRVNNVDLQYTISPKFDVFPYMDWIKSGSEIEPILCVDLIWKNPSSVNVSLNRTLPEHSLFSLDNTPNSTLVLDEEEEQVCIEAKAGTHLELVDGMTILIGIHEFEIMVAQNTTRQLIFPQSGLLIQANNSIAGWGQWTLGGELRLNHEGSCEAEHTTNVPMKPIEGDWIWDLEVKSSATIPVVEEVPLTIKAPVDSLITWCQKNEYTSQPEFVYTVSEGPQLYIVESNNSSYNDWTGPVQFTNNTLTIYNPTDQNITVETEQHGTGDRWVANNTFVLLAGQSTIISATPPEDGYSFAWLEHDSWKVELHLSHHEV